MSLALKTIITRFVLTFLIIILLLFPFDAAGITTLKLFVNELLVIDIKYIIAGILCLIAGIVIIIYNTKCKKNILNKEKILNEMANKVLIDSILVVLTAQGFIQPIIPVVVVIRDTVIGSFKYDFAVKVALKKVKDACFIIGIILTLFYNLPFELANLKVSEFLLVAGSVLSVVSAFEYYYQIKNKM